jgi:hypothetical protein
MMCQITIYPREAAFKLALKQNMWHLCLCAMLLNISGPHTRHTAIS